MAVIDLSQLPAPDVVETLDFEAILAERKATLISLYPEDEQEAIADIDAGVRATGEISGRECLPRGDFTPAH